MDNSIWLSARKYDVIKELERCLMLQFHVKGGFGGANWALHIGLSVQDKGLFGQGDSCYLKSFLLVVQLVGSGERDGP